MIEYSHFEMLKSVLISVFSRTDRRRYVLDGGDPAFRFFTAKVEPPGYGVQLWKNGPYWAECNVGATKPEEYGYYFWWCDTVGYRRENDAWVAVDGSTSDFRLNGINTPTDAEFSALIDNCDRTWTTVNGVNGQLFTGRGDYAGSPSVPSGTPTSSRIARKDPRTPPPRQFFPTSPVARSESIC